MTAFAYLRFEMREFITPFIGPAIAKTPAVGIHSSALRRRG